MSIKSILLFVFITFISCLTAFENESKRLCFTQNEKISFKRNNKLFTPKIIIFNCHYGAGHKMATQGIIESLPECEIKVIDIYDEPLKPLDPIKAINPQWSNQELYNTIAKKEYNRFLNVAAKVASLSIHFQKTRIEKLLMEFISKDKPDLIISCIPLVNPMILNVTKKLNIPLLVVTTDIDISAFCYGFKESECLSNRNQFRITVPFSKETWDQVFIGKLPNSVKSSLQYGFGYPTRHAFSEAFEETTLAQVRKHYQISSNENVVLVMMGGNTAQAAQDYAQLLLSMKQEDIQEIIGPNKSKNKIRLICLSGDVTQESNFKLMTRLNKLNDSKNKSNNSVVIHACPGTNHIAELVSLPELTAVISKPGGSTVNEMIKKKVPMIYHVSKVPLDWECGNMHYGVNRGLGRPFRIDGNLTKKNRTQLKNVLTYVFTLHTAIQNGSKDIPEAAYDFTKNLRFTVKEMLQGY